MNIQKNYFMVKMTGICKTEYDVMQMQMWDFGFSMEAISRKFAKDNKIKISEARPMITDMIYRNVMKRQKEAKATQ